MDNEKNNLPKQNRDLTGRNVDRTSGVDRTGRSVDRTSGVDRTGRSVDRTSRNVDRTSGVDRTSRSVDRTSGTSRRASQPSKPVAREEVDYFPELKISSSDIDITSNSAAPDVNKQENVAELNASAEPEQRDIFSEPVDTKRADEYEDISSSSSKDIYSSSSNDKYQDIFSGRERTRDIYDSTPDGEMENLSSSTPRIDYDELEAEETISNRKRLLKKVGKIALSCFLVFVIVGCIVGVAFAVYVFGFVDDSIDFNLYDLTLNYTTKVYSKNPEYDADNPASKEWVEYEEIYYQNRTWVSINDVSQNVIYAIVAGEDERFYKHKGVDWKRTLGSFANMFLDFWDTKQGGSTITQQLVKNLTGDDEQSSIRKIREIMRARNIEKTYAKDTIMECYMNVVYFGNNCYGIETAAEYYFGKSASELTAAEAACITAITKSPDGYDPIKKPEANKTRREWIINNMYEINKIYNGERGITKKERDEALKQELVFVNKSSDAEKKEESAEEETKENTGYSYFTDAVINQVIEDLMESKDYTYEYAENMVFRGGLRIYATVDTKAQAAVDTVFTTDDNWSQVYGTKQKAQGAITVMDYSGHIVALAGGRGEKTDRRGLNRAVDSPRQPGSTMKPIGAYAPALEDNLITWSTKVENTTIKLGGVTFKNAGGYTSDPVTIQKAIQSSYNLVAVRVLNKYGAQKSFDFVTKKFGITTLIESEMIDGKEYSDIGISQLALGGSTYGLTTAEEAAAYATFGNGGLYYAPTTYTVVKDQSNKTLLEYDDEPIEALSADTAFIMNKMMQTVVTGGTGSAAAFDGWEIFGKTGTTNDDKDRWFAGGTPRYVASCWFGCDKPYSLSRLSSGTNPALRLWRASMQGIHQGKSKTSFPKCSTVMQAEYCVATGGIATDKCAEKATGYYKEKYAPVCSECGKKPTASQATSQPASQPTPPPTPQPTPSQATTSQVQSQATASQAASQEATSQATQSKDSAQSDKAA